MNNPFPNMTIDSWHMFIDLLKIQPNERQGTYF